MRAAEFTSSPEGQLQSIPLLQMCWNLLKLAQTQGHVSTPTIT